VAIRKDKWGQAIRYASVEIGKEEECQLDDDAARDKNNNKIDDYLNLNACAAIFICLKPFARGVILFDFSLITPAEHTTRIFRVVTI
jgi:hypothetical protein